MFIVISSATVACWPFRTRTTKKALQTEQHKGSRGTAEWTRYSQSEKYKYNRSEKRGRGIDITHRSTNTTAVKSVEEVYPSETDEYKYSSSEMRSRV